MSDDDLALLFNCDFHHSRNGTRGETGTGIGLSLCKELIELNSGMIKAESKLGEGTVFSFTIASPEKTKEVDLAASDTAFQSVNLDN